MPNDKGSSKKTKKRRKQALDILEDDADDNEGSKLVLGFEREFAFFSGLNRHLLHQGSLTTMLSEYAKNIKARPELLKQTDIFQKDLAVNELRKKVSMVSGKPATMTAIDLGIISFPNGLRLRREDVTVPSWNTWDEKLPHHFFNTMGSLISDDGYLAVLSVAENFDHRRKIFDAAENRKKFKIAQSYSVILSSPFYKVGSDIQVHQCFMLFLHGNGSVNFIEIAFPIHSIAQYPVLLVFPRYLT